MKIKNKLIKVVSLIFSILLFVSCSEESPIPSNITFFPTFEFEPTVIVALGDTFTPEAIATEGGGELPIVVNGSVDTNTVGVYSVGYSATNSDGFDGAVTQVVIVHDPTLIGSDVTGCFHDVGRPARTGCITAIEGTSSIFFASDWGYGGTFPVYFQMDGDVITDIDQPYINGNDFVDLTYDPIEGVFTVFIPALPFTYTFQYD